MPPPREPVTISDLKKSNDKRFVQVDKRFVQVDTRFVRVERRLDRLQRTKADKRDLKALGDELGREMGRLREGILQEIRRGQEETRRHFDVVAESLRDDVRLLAEQIGHHSDRLDNHSVRLLKLEGRH